MSVCVQIKSFEGPMDLLLCLIRRNEMDIFDVNIHEITQQYLEYIEQMRELNLEVAGEFMSMAATLLHIKSRTLLPQEPGEDDDAAADDQDPRKALAQQLLEYQAFKEAGAKLGLRTLLGQHVFQPRMGQVTKKPSLESETAFSLNIPPEEGVFRMSCAYVECVRRAKTQVHHVRPEPLQSLRSRVRTLAASLMRGQKKIFTRLCALGDEGKTSPQKDRGRVLVTFLSLLELGRMGFVRLFQSGYNESIHVQVVKELSPLRATDGLSLSIEE